MHKKFISGKPVACSNVYHTSKISKFIDYHLKPHRKDLPSYIQDTTDFINKLETKKDI